MNSPTPDAIRAAFAGQPPAHALTPEYLAYIGPKRAAAEFAALSLLQLQHQFARMLPGLLQRAHASGYEVSLGEAWRPNEDIPRLHSHRLAIDLNLFRDGTYLRDTSHHLPLGLYWESIGGTWGGRFDDGNHYSLTWRGMK